MDARAIRKMPIGIQDFEKLIGDGYVYVDKTERIHQLVTRGGYYFLSRPAVSERVFLSAYVIRLPMTQDFLTESMLKFIRAYSAGTVTNI